MSARKDPVPAIIALLNTNSDTALLLDGRVYGAEIPASQQRFMPQSCLVVNPMGLGSSPPGVKDFTKLRVSRFDLRVYAATPAEAGEVAALVDDFMHQMRRQARGGVLLYWAQRVSGPVFYRADPGDWPVMVNTYDVMHADEVDA